MRLFDKFKILLKIFFVFIFVFLIGTLNVKAISNSSKSNFDYKITVSLNGADKNESTSTSFSNEKMAKDVFDYYNSLSKNNNQLNEEYCNYFDNSTFYSSVIMDIINKFFYIIVVVAIVILIILSMLDFTKATAQKDEDLLKSATKHFTKRLIVMVLLIFLPIVLNPIINYINSSNNDFNKKIDNSRCSSLYISKDESINNTNWGTVNLKKAVKNNYIFLGWTTNQNGPSVIYKDKIKSSTLIKEKIKLYSLFIKSDQEIEKYNDMYLHNKGSSLKYFSLSMKDYILSTVKKGFNYYADFDKWYYAPSDGKIYTGFKKINNKTYYFGDNGDVHFGWVKVGNNQYYFNTKGEMVFGKQNIGGVIYNFDEKTGVLVVSNSDIYMNYQNAKEIPKSLLQLIGSSDPSIVIADENGNVIAARKPNIRRAGASTTKLFTGYAAVKLLDVNKDKVTGKAFAHNMSEPFNSHAIGIGQKISVSRAAVMSFPNSSNETAESIPIAIGYKYYKCSSDQDAHRKGMKKINEFIKSIGCKNSNLENGSGLGGCFVAPDGLPANGCTYGHSANDLAFVAINAMRDANFVNAFVKYSSCENGYGSYPKCRSLAKYRNVNGLFFIKSGTGGWTNHGIWAFNKNGKKYYIAVLGVRDGYNKISFTESLYNWAIKDLIK